MIISSIVFGICFGLLIGSYTTTESEGGRGSNSLSAEVVADADGENS